MKTDDMLKLIEKFIRTFPKDRAYLINGGDGRRARITNVSSTVGAHDWLNVSWLPFGDGGPMAGKKLPKTFGGLKVRYHCNRDTPLSAEELLFDEFSDTYCFAEAGVIEKGDGTAVRLSSLSLSCNSSASRAAEYGCPAGQTAILAAWLPVGLMHVERKRDSLPKESGIDASKIPPQETWVVFPLEFKGIRVYYKRGAQAFAL